jgi:hypothetical protein
MRKEALPPPPKEGVPRTRAVARKRRGRARLAAPEPPDGAECELELDYQSLEEQCKVKPLPPGIALAPSPGASYGELFHHTYTVEPEEPEEG